MKPLSLRRFLLLGILMPVLLLIAANGVSLYRQALQAVNTAYDRTLLASAKVIGEQGAVVRGVHRLQCLPVQADAVDGDQQQHRHQDAQQQEAPQRKRLHSSLTR